MKGSALGLVMNTIFSIIKQTEYLQFNIL